MIAIKGPLLIIIMEITFIVHASLYFLLPYYFLVIIALKFLQSCISCTTKQALQLATYLAIIIVHWYYW